MKTILCYGDSNTWGNVPRSDARYPKSVRWPGALQELLGEGYEVISEGLCGRTFVALDPKRPHRTGITHLRALLESAAPLDLVIVMLGTNDVKSTYSLSSEDIASHLEETIGLIQSDELDMEETPKILVICPPSVITPSDGKIDPRMERASEKFESLPGLFKRVAEKMGCEFLNAGDHISSSAIDGYHLDEAAHLALAKAVRNRIANLSI
ncbi:MAG: SGNH/GDSL hydrolase family protein [Candidatus Taylorbacteria bacterium]|nr:SGNH/GDSL hydrolase family protein [Candidatus Taylorbacteria bacterium]